MSPEDQAVYFNAVPLFILAGAYLMVAAALAPTLWRERRRVSVTDVGLAAIFPRDRDRGRDLRGRGAPRPLADRRSCLAGVRGDARGARSRR